MVKIYRVGGFVRDQLMGLGPGDEDFVMVGATDEWMLKNRFQKVGKHFPVYLHPETKQEYALARIERKTAPGHKGFEFVFGPETTLTQDLKRRDFTINAIAQEIDSLKIIDPFDGQKDLKDKLLRHVSKHFVEDPLRVLRAARFYARFENFSIHPETLSLMREITLSGELATLSFERIFTELSKALATNTPSRFFTLLDKARALEVLFPEVFALKGIPQTAKYHPEGDCFVHTMLVVDESKKLSDDLAIAFACLVHDLGKADTPAEVLPGHKGHEIRGIGHVKSICARLKVPKSWEELALKVTQYHLKAHLAQTLRASTIVDLLHDLNAYRKPQLFEKFLLCCEADNRGKQSEHYPQANFLRHIFCALQKVSLPEEFKELPGEQIQKKMRELRIRATKKEMHTFKSSL